MSLWVAVHGLTDGVDNVSADSLNRPVRELTERTNYLYENLQALLSAGTFETVRLVNVPLVLTGNYIPVRGDFVYLDAVQGKYAKALAQLSSGTYSAADSTFAVGLLVAVNGTSGTLVLFGREPLITVGVPWLLSDLMESGEVFRNGPYYLSAVEPGKMTANANGLAVYLGYFVEDPLNPGYGGSVLLSPQYKDLKEAHTHQNYMLYPQPAGTQYVSGPTPADTHVVQGFNTVTAGGPGDHIPRLVLQGLWTGVSDVQYTLWLSRSSSPTEVRIGSSAPTDFSDCYLHWVSSDSIEGSGAVRIWSYESLVTIGTKGVQALLENSLITDWDDPYTVAADTEDERTWVVQVPSQTRGWLARHYRQYFGVHQAVDSKFSFVLMGGPANNVDQREWDQLTIKCAELWKLTYTPATNPSDGETLTINGTVFEFDDDNVVTAGNIAVTLGIDAAESFTNMLDVILAQGLTNIDVALNVDDSHLIIAVPTASTITKTIASVTVVLVSAGIGDLGTGSGGLLVYDRYHMVLIATTSFWNGATYWTLITLKNDLQLMAIPYASDGTPAVVDTYAVADYWDCQYADEAPGAYFVYAMGMHSALSQQYPPIPVTAAVLILNGVELDAYDVFHGTTNTYRTTLSSLCWYPDMLGSVPWPRDWIDINNPGSLAYQQKLMFAFVRLSIGEMGLVTSLRPAANSPIKVVRWGTNNDAATGDLALDLDLNMKDDPANLVGYQVFKAINGQQFRKGPVVERIISSNGSVNITSNVGAPLGQGTVDLTIGNVAYEGDFEEVALQNAKQELMGMFPYVRLLGWVSGGLTNVNTAFVAKFRVPHDLGTSTSKWRVIVYATVFGEVTIPWVGGGSKQYAGVDFAYSILPDFNPLTPPSGEAWNSLDQTLPDGLMTMTTPIHADIPFGKYVSTDPSKPIYTAYDPMLIHNNPAEGSDIDRKLAQVLGNPFPIETEITGWDVSWGTACVKPGSLVAVRFSRSNALSTPAYVGSIGFINLRWRLVAV